MSLKTVFKDIDDMVEGKLKRSESQFEMLQTMIKQEINEFNNYQLQLPEQVKDIVLIEMKNA